MVFVKMGYVVEATPERISTLKQFEADLRSALGREEKREQGP
jgi:hypothetical protein